MRLAPALPALALLLLPHLPALAHTACADAPLRLNEIMAGPARDWDGSGVFSSRDDEWIELVNVGPSPLDLTGWLLTDGDRIPRLALGGTLAPGEHHAFFGSESYNWEKAHGFPAFGFSLANSGDQVMLWQVVGPDTVLVESYAYLAHEAAADRAAGRSPDGDGSWALFDGLNPYTGTLTPAGNGCAPTPGTANACVSTPARPMTWGRVKALYR
jgi:hypothetical protein